MGRPRRDIPPLFDDLPPAGERNVLEELQDNMVSLEKQPYEVAEELRYLFIWMIILATVTTPVFPFLPQTVDVGGWALWWLGGAITIVMECVAQYWLIAVILGGLFLLSALYLVLASQWLKHATKRAQWCMYGSVVLIIPNLLSLLAILVLWLAVIMVWAFIAFLVIGSIGLILSMWVHD